MLLHPSDWFWYTHKTWDRHLGCVKYHECVMNVNLTVAHSMPNMTNEPLYVNPHLANVGMDGMWVDTVYENLATGRLCGKRASGEVFFNLVYSDQSNAVPGN